MKAKKWGGEMRPRKSACPINLEQYSVLADALVVCRQLEQAWPDSERFKNAKHVLNALCEEFEQKFAREAGKTPEWER